MSSDSSVSSGSRIGQFGLYRTIDARTEEFLRLSRKRQIRQGCACAAASTAITVTVVIIVILIYEYAIAVEWSLVQRKRSGNEIYDATNVTKDTPFADRLDRSYFGFDQDYFEQMPLLVNALQESNYIDPLLEMSRPIVRKRFNKTVTTKRPNHTPDTYRQSKIRRTSPRPFIFEYRSPTPLPFSKTYGSRSWVDGYRNAQRLQNIRQVIKYLEKTINAKMGDMYSKPSSPHTSIAFSGVYVEPMVDKFHNSDNQSQSLDMQQQSSDNVELFQTNHQSDPLFNYKPNSPGDVNLLADALWRFAPGPIPSVLDNKHINVPMFKKITNYKRNCVDGKCNNNINDGDNKIVELSQSSTEHTTLVSTTKPKSFSVMLNVFPFKSSTSSEYEKQSVKTHQPIEKIYLTTSKPVRFQFKRKSNLPVRRTYYRYKKPKYLIQKKNELEEKAKHNNKERTTQEPMMDDATKMVVHVNVYSPEDKTESNKKIDNVTERIPSTTHQSTSAPITEIPFELSSGQVEDSHDGSSGVIPVPEITESTPPILPYVTTLIPFFNTDTESNTWVTNPLDVIKFSPEDAKVPDHYLNMDLTTQMSTSTPSTTTLSSSTEINRRVSVDSIVDKQRMLIIRLKNSITTTEAPETTTEEVIDNTSERTYVPQTNGHYRSFGSRNRVFSPERNRKRRIEASVTGFRTYVPMYVEIKRNKTNALDNDRE